MATSVDVGDYWQDAIAAHVGRSCLIYSKTLSPLGPVRSHYYSSALQWAPSCNRARHRLHLRLPEEQASVQAVR